MRVNPFPKLKPSQEAEGLELLRSTPTLYKLWAWGPGRGRDLPTITADGPSVEQRASGSWLALPGGKWI